MSGLEVPAVIGIIGCVAAVVSAFENGGALIRRIKDTRKTKDGGKGPIELEEKVAQAPIEIRKETERGMKRFGSRFEKGDPDTVILMLHITVELQNGLLERLRNADFDDEADLRTLIDVADLGRSNTVGALNSLYQRLLQGNVVEESPSPLTQHSLPVLLPQMTGLSGSTPSINSRVQTLASSTNEAPTTEEAISPVNERRRTSRFDPLGFRKQRQNQKSVDEGKPSPNERKVRKQSAPSPTVANPKMKPAGIPSPSTRHSRTVSDNSDCGNEHVHLETSEDRPNTFRRKTFPALVVAKDSGSDPLDSSMDTQMMRSMSDASSTPPTSVDSTYAPQLTADNKYLGLCKGAVKLMYGDRKAMVKGRDYQYLASSQVPMLTCKECHFKETVNPATIWQEVRGEVEKGLKYRWSFLAKSHIPQKLNSLTIDRKYLYRCLFCIFLGHRTTNPMQKEAYLDHISAEHRGTVIDSVVLYRTFCISDHECDNSEDFDINLLPLNLREQAERRYVDFRLSSDAPEQRLMDVDAYLSDLTLS